MAIVEDLKNVIAGFPKATLDPSELVRLQRFLTEMKAAGVAKTREYGLPQPDTIERAAKDLPLRGHITRR